jgi:hypothetical protein
MSFLVRLEGVFVTDTRPTQIDGKVSPTINR